MTKTLHNQTWVRLGEVCEIVAKQVSPTLPEFAGLPHISAENIESGTLRLRGVQTAAEDGMTSGKYLFEAGDVLYSKLRPYLRKVTMAPFRGVCSADMYPLRPRGETLAADYLAWLLLSDDFTKYADEESKRARMPKLNREQLFAWTTRLPSLTEQRRIVGRLREQMTEAERASAAVQAQLDSAQLFIQAVLRDSLNAPGCVTAPVAACLQEVTQGIGEQWSEFPVLGATRAGLAPAKEGVGKNPGRYKPVVPGTIFYNPMRILLGSIAMLDDGDASGITSPDYVVMRGVEGRLHPVWFYHWFRSRYGAEFILSLTRGAVRERLLFNRLAKASLTIPAWPTQLRAVEQFRELRTFRQAATARLETIASLPTALLRQAFFPG